MFGISNDLEDDTHDDIPEDTNTGSVFYSDLLRPGELNNNSIKELSDSIKELSEFMQNVMSGEQSVTGMHNCHVLTVFEENLQNQNDSLHSFKTSQLWLQYSSIVDIPCTCRSLRAEHMHGRLGTPPCRLGYDMLPLVTTCT